MQSKKTHAQHLRIVEKQEDTSNAGADFDIKGDLARNEAAKDALAAGTALRSGPKDLTNQASHHHKRNGN